MAAFSRELNELIGKRILVRLEKEHAQLGTLVHVFDDHLQVRPDNAENILFIPSVNILYVHEA